MELSEIEKKYKTLWKEIFKDNNYFINNYFNAFFNKDNVYYIEKDNDIVSMLLSIDYSYCYNENIYPFSYLSGILTTVNYRKQGLCEQLLNTTLNDLYKKNYLLCGLIAADNKLINYYNKFSFSSCCNGEQGSFSKKQINKTLVDKYVLEEHNGYYFKELSPFITMKDKSISHSEHTLELYKSKEYLSYKIGYQYTSRAMAIGIKKKNVFEVLDISYFNNEAKQALLSHLAFKTKKDITYSCYNPNGERLSNQMIRIVNAEKALEIYAEKNPTITASIHIKDLIIKENNITILISNGKIKHIPNSYCIKVINIEDLTKTIFNNSYLFLMLDK